MFVYRIVREIGSLAAALGGIDAIVFTGGIGENDAATRAEVAMGCAWLGLTLDKTPGAGGARLISAATSRLQAWVVPTDEERMIARHTAEVLGLQKAQQIAWPPVSSTERELAPASSLLGRLGR